MKLDRELLRIIKSTPTRQTVIYYFIKVSEQDMSNPPRNLFEVNCHLITHKGWDCRIHAYRNYVINHQFLFAARWNDDKFIKQLEEELDNPESKHNIITGILKRNA